MKSKHGNFLLIPGKDCLEKENILLRTDADFLDAELRKEGTCDSRFVLLGISESVGPLANYGRSGAEHAFHAFLSFFRKMPRRTFPLSFLGCIEFIGPKELSPTAASEMVIELDDFVLSVLHALVKPHQIPMVVGGGHNNALPLIRWANSVHKELSVVNIDAHTDCRPTENRHSGNSFSTAIEEGSLKDYSVLGLHQDSLSDAMVSFMEQNAIFYTCYEAYLMQRRKFFDDYKHVSEGRRIGLEVDLDCIANMPSSAESPSGWRLDDIRRLLLGVNPEEVLYLHLTEAAPISEQEKRHVGKSLSYLCLDFLNPTE